MPVHVIEEAVPAEPFGTGITRKRLFTDKLLQDTSVVLDRIAVAAGSSMQFEAPADSIIWLQVLGGEGKLQTPYTLEPLSDSASITLPSGAKGELTTDKGVTILQAHIRNLGQLDPASLTNPPRLVAMDWRHEDVYESKKDRRKRVFLVTSAICNTSAFRVDMVIYPKGTGGPAFHREGAGTISYIVSGNGDVKSGGREFALSAGDLIYFAHREQQALQASRDTELRFLQIIVPGNFETVWADKRNVSTWVKTGIDIMGRMPTVEAQMRREGW